MIKNICIYITLLTLFLLNVSETLAIKIDPYLVTEGKEFVGNPHLNRTYFYKNMPINYQSGKVVLSFNPDGTGDTVIGEELFVNVGDNTFTFKTSSAACNGIGNTTMKPLDITHLLNKGLNNLRVTYRKVWCNKQQISQMYLVHFNDYEPTAAPFLDLPWDYTSKGLSFVEAATKITAYFDHEYPLLSADWIVQEPIDVNSDLVDFTGVKGNKPYSKHDGYDYAAISEAFLNDPVLSAAPGIASFHNNCSACGNAIYIDHQNGYQTRYYHLQPDGLITNNPNQKITVINRQQIGKIGSTGRSTGAHIHFMLIQDKNGDGNFDDNIPDGIVDPYGWQGNGADPWPQFTFTQNDETKTGTKSNYLWRNSMQHITKTLPTTGGNYTHDRFNFIFPNGTTTKDLIFSLKPAPYAEPSAVLQPVSYVIDATTQDGFGNFITQFNKLFTITFKLLLSDTSRLKPDTLSIYSSSDGTNWIKENTTINTQSNVATTQVNHLTQFAFMGEKLDSIAPETTLQFNNQSVGETVFYEPVTISFQTNDEPSINSLGIAYTLFKINDEEWNLYTEPFVIEKIGDYIISYYSVDKDNNTEDIKIFEFKVAEILTPTPTIEPTIVPTQIPTVTFTPFPTVTISTYISPTLTPTPNDPKIPNNLTIKKIIQNIAKEVKTTIQQNKPIIASVLILLKQYLHSS